MWWIVLKHLLCGAKLALPSFFKVLAYVQRPVLQTMPAQTPLSFKPLRPL